MMMITTTIRSVVKRNTVIDNIQIAVLWKALPSESCTILTSLQILLRRANCTVYHSQSLTKHPEAKLLQGKISYAQTYITQQTNVGPVLTYYAAVRPGIHYTFSFCRNLSWTSPLPRRHAVLSCARHFAVVRPRFNGCRSAALRNLKRNLNSSWPTEPKNWHVFYSCLRRLVCKHQLWFYAPTIRTSLLTCRVTNADYLPTYFTPFWILVNPYRTDRQTKSITRPIKTAA